MALFCMRCGYVYSLKLLLKMKIMVHHPEWCAKCNIETEGKGGE